MHPEVVGKGPTPKDARARLCSSPLTGSRFELRRSFVEKSPGRSNVIEPSRSGAALTRCVGPRIGSKSLALPCNFHPQLQDASSEVERGSLELFPSLCAAGSESWFFFWVAQSAAMLRIISPMQNPDQLRELFEMQRALNLRIGVDTSKLDEQGQTQWVLNYTRAMSQELAELTDSVPWKWWAKYQKFDHQNAKVEVVDLFHFLISLAQVLGMSADDVYQAYLKKNEVNLKRQDSGYQEKDPEDSKHI